MEGNCKPVTCSDVFAYWNAKKRKDGVYQQLRKQVAPPSHGDSHSNSSSGIGSMSGECACSSHTSRPPPPLVIEDVEIPVWVGGCEKWLTGLTKRTTCDDVIYALLSHEAQQHNLDLAMYAILERWRGVERPLSGRTKIMKVWRTWGSEARNVKLSLRKVENFLDTSSEVSHTRRPRKRSSRDPKSLLAFPKESSKKSNHYSGRHARHASKHEAPQGSNHEKHGRKHKQSSDNLDSHGRESGSGSDSKHQLQKKSPSFDPVSRDMRLPQPKPSCNSIDPYGAKAFHEMIHVILGQEKAIQQQVDAMKETDNQIESFETKAKKHQHEAKSQNVESSSSNGLFPKIKEQDMEAYLHICDSILELQDKISDEQKKIDYISGTISEEQSNIASEALDEKDNSPIQEEIDVIRSEIDRSLSLSLAQQEQLQLVSETLGDCERQLRRKRQYLETLATYINQESLLEADIQKHNDADQIDAAVAHELLEESQQLESSSKRNSLGISGSKECLSVPNLESDIIASSPQTESNTVVPDYENLEPNVDTNHNRIDNQKVQVDTSLHEESVPDVQYEHIEVISDDSTKPRSILKSRPPGYSVRFADEVGEGDYVNYDPCLTQVFEYSKYDSHDYENVDDIDLGYVDYVNEPYEYENDEGSWLDPLCKISTSVSQNVDTGEVCVDTEVDSRMVPYFTYQTYGAETDNNNTGKMNSSDDSNSDTGLSSMHSDDAAIPVLETLV